MVIDSATYREQGFSQSQKNEKLLAIRGNVYDRQDRPLTRNIIHYSLGAHPSKIKNKQSFSELIANATGREADYYLNKLESKSDSVADVGSAVSGSSKGIDYIPEQEVPEQEQ